MDTRLSKPLIPGFFENNGINRADYLPEEYSSFNACFTRRIRPELRPIDDDPTHLIAPCDSKLSAYAIDENSLFFIKGAPYSVADLVADEELAGAYVGGTCLIFRLCVEDYHRYHFLDDGTQEEPRFIKGILHTVQPVALDHCNIYHRNCREITTLHTAHFGEIVQIEVGAMLVGRICNHKGVTTFKRGDEKGYFAYGGSTVVCLFKQGAVEIDPAILENTNNDLETVVRLGHHIGMANTMTEGVFSR